VKKGKYLNNFLATGANHHTALQVRTETEVKIIIIICYYNYNIFLSIQGGFLKQSSKSLKLKCALYKVLYTKIAKQNWRHLVYLGAGGAIAISTKSVHA